MYYFAYGSNMNYLRMFTRCAGAKVHGVGEVTGYRLSFMENNSKVVVANIEEAERFITKGVIYEVTESDIISLDRYEGHPYVYKREMITVGFRGTMIEAITYKMNREVTIREDLYNTTFTRKYGIPKNGYFKHILDGYTMFNLHKRTLMEATEYSKERKSERVERYKSNSKKTKSSGKNRSDG